LRDWEQGLIVLASVSGNLPDRTLRFDIPEANCKCFWQWHVAIIFGIILGIVHFLEVFQTQRVVKRSRLRNAEFEKAQDDDQRPT
jgi:hypothetical protein